MTYNAQDNIKFRKYAHSKELFVRAGDMANFVGIQQGNIIAYAMRRLRDGEMTRKHLVPRSYKRGLLDVATVDISTTGLEQLLQMSKGLQNLGRDVRVRQLIAMMREQEAARVKPSEPVKVEEAVPAVLSPSQEEDAGADPADDQPMVEPVVQRIDGELWADSRDVAATFKRKHGNVLASYRDMHCSDEFRRMNFNVFKTNDLTGESIGHVMMTRNGFAFLALGFTGEKAGAFKEAYINRFDAMERELRRDAGFSVQVMIDDPERMLVVIQGLLGQRSKDKAQIAHLSERAKQLDYIDERAAALEGARTITAVASALKIKRPDLVKWMLGTHPEIPNKNPWIRRDPEHRDELCPATYGSNHGYVTSKNTRFYNRKYNRYEIAQTPLITPMGESYLSKALKSNHRGFLKIQAAAERRKKQGSLNL